MNCVSCDICVYHLGLFVFFRGVFLSSRVTGTCPVTTDLIMRVYVRTTTTTIPVPRVFLVGVPNLPEFRVPGSGSTTEQTEMSGTGSFRSYLDVLDFQIPVLRSYRAYRIVGYRH